MAVQIASAELERSLAEKFFRQAPRQLVTGPSCQLVVTLEKGADNVTTLWEAGGELIRREGELRRGEPLHLQGDVRGSLHGALADDDGSGGQVAQALVARRQQHQEPAQQIESRHEVGRAE